MNNDTPATTPAPFACFRCNDGQTPLYCLNCAGELLKATPQPTHSAQEAAERAANGPTLTKAHALTADRIMTLITENLAAVPTTIEAISEMLHDPALSEAVALEIEEHEHRHFPSTPTQSQQPPLSPGSGETMREALKEAIDMAERLVQSMDYLGTGSDSQAALKEQMADEDRIEVLRRALAQPATPPLTSGENPAKSRGEAASAWYLSITATQRATIEQLPSFEIFSLGYQVGRGMLAPPLPSIGDGKDGLMEALKKIERMSSDRNRDGHSLMFEACCIARDALRSAQSPQSGREEKN